MWLPVVRIYFLTLLTVASNPRVVEKDLSECQALALRSSNISVSLCRIGHISDYRMSGNENIAVGNNSEDQNMYSPRTGRSVLDFDTEDELRGALASADGEEHGNDWRLPVADPYAEEQTIDGELHRLLTLKSYLLLDADQEEAFVRLTEEARRVYDVPTSLIAIVDLGRQYFFAGVGEGQDRETPRSVAFCAHTILAKVR